MAPNRLWTIGLITAISLTRIGMGIYNSLSGPTLLYLSHNVDVSVSTISTMFTGRSVGISLGAISAGLIKNRVGPKFPHLLTFGFGIGTLGVMEIAVPWIKEFWILVVDITIAGILYGYLDTGLQGLILYLWGEKASRSQVQLFHFMFSVGAFIAPFMASPFLAMAEDVAPSEQRCPNVNTSGQTMSPTLINSIASVTENDTQWEHVRQDTFNPTGWSYVIAAAWMALVSLFLIILAACKVEAKVSAGISKQGASSEDREEEPVRDLLWIFLALIGYYFCSIGTENVFLNYIYSVSICSELGFTVTQASSINSVFWLGLGSGRLSGVVAAMYLKPRTIILIVLCGSILDSVIMSIFGEHTPWIAWLVSAMHGYTTSLLYPTGVSWVSQFTNMSGTYMFVMNIGNALGALTMLPLAGYIFDINPFSVMHLVLILAALNTPMFGLLWFAGVKHKRLLAKRRKQAESRLLIKLVTT